jgi:antitoxin component YwqK of YwqJK toxin-antitoxin module
MIYNILKFNCKRSGPYYKIILLIFMATTFLCGRSQAGAGKKYYEININSSDGYTKAIVASKKIRIKPNENYTYYWYSYNKIISTKGGYDGSLLHGDYVCFYANNNLREKGSFKKGLKKGKWMSWYENGKIKEIAYWSNSLRCGERKLYDESGNIILIENYKNDKFNGAVIQYQSGKITTIKYYKNGVEYFPKTKDDTKRADDSSTSKNKRTVFDRIKKIFQPRSKKGDTDNSTDSNKAE